MKSFWNNYKSSIVLLGAILLGGIVGATMGEKAVVLKPIGELFLNLLFMTLVPLVFFCSFSNEEIDHKLVHQSIITSKLRILEL